MFSEKPEKITWALSLRGWRYIRDGKCIKCGLYILTRGPLFPEGPCVEIWSLHLWYFSQHDAVQCLKSKGKLWETASAVRWCQRFWNEHNGALRSNQCWVLTCYWTRSHEALSAGDDPFSSHDPALALHASVRKEALKSALRILFQIRKITCAGEMKQYCIGLDAFKWGGLHLVVGVVGVFIAALMLVQ